MRRSGRLNNDSVPAFFTRSKAKNFFNSSSTASVNSSPTKSRNGKKQHDEETEQPGDPEELMVQSKNENAEIPGQDIQKISEPQETVLQIEKSNGMETQNEVTDESQNSMRDCKPEQVSEEIESVELEIKYQPLKEENLHSSDEQNKDTSATTKALKQLKRAIQAKKNARKKQRAPLIIRRRKLNERLNRILMPKSGLMFLNELKPGCSFKIHEKPDANPPVFIAQVEHNDKTIAVGQGKTKSSAKNVAAENAIRVLVAEALSQQTVNRKNTNGEDVKQSQSNNSSTSVVEPMEISDDLSLAGLASFAMYKMFTEWQNQGTDFPHYVFQPKKKVAVTKTTFIKKELPSNAEKLHPSFLLNTMRPGIISEELERHSKDNVSFVTVGYEIDGFMYKGSGPNKKEARRRAAQTALSSLYGLSYDD